MMRLRLISYMMMILLIFTVICSLCKEVESLVISKAQVKIKSVPEFFIKGTLDSIPSGDAETITLTFGPFTQTIPLSEFKAQGKRLIYKGSEKESGISKFSFNLRNGKFIVEGKSAVLTALENPFKIHFIFDDNGECLIAEFRKEKKTRLFSGQMDDSSICVQPVADAGSDQNVHVHDVVTLDGRQSSCPQNNQT